MRKRRAPVSRYLSFLLWFASPESFESDTARELLLPKRIGGQPATVYSLSELQDRVGEQLKQIISYYEHGDTLNLPNAPVVFQTDVRRGRARLAVDDLDGWVSLGLLHLFHERKQTQLVWCRGCESFRLDPRRATFCKDCTLEDRLHKREQVRRRVAKSRRPALEKKSQLRNQLQQQLIDLETKARAAGEAGDEPSQFRYFQRVGEIERRLSLLKRQPPRRSPPKVQIVVGGQVVPGLFVEWVGFDSARPSKKPRPSEKRETPRRKKSPRPPERASKDLGPPRRSDRGSFKRRQSRRRRRRRRSKPRR